VRILVTGASGFVGRAIAARLAENAEVYGTCSRRLRSPAPAGSNGEPFPADITDPKDLASAVPAAAFDVVVHSAGLAHQFGGVPESDFRLVNVLGTENVCHLAAARGAGHLILVSSAAVYGHHGAAEVDESQACRPSGAYALSKLDAEQAAISICRSNGIALTVFRPATVIGEGDPGNLNRLIRLIARGRFVWLGRGLNRKTLVPRSEVAAAVVAAVRAGPATASGIFNLASESLTMREIVETIYAALGREAPHFHVPARPVLALATMLGRVSGSRRVMRVAESLAKWVSDDVFSGRKFRDHFAYVPQQSVGEALRRQVRYSVAEPARPEAAGGRQRR
jgi:nucleoside-diphosphate-sugar epimerase